MPDDETPETPAPAAETPPETPDAPLGDAGEKALAAWKERARVAEREAKRAKELEAEVEKLRQAQMSDQDKALEQAKREAAEAARSEALASASARLFKAELRAAVTGKMSPEAAKDLLVDAEVATKLLGLGEIPVTADGDIDSEAISQAVADYVSARPYLAPQGAGSPGSADQGARPSTPGQLTRADLQNMTPEQIVAAKAEGRLQKLLGGS